MMMAPANVIRGMTPRLIGVTGLVVTLCVTFAGTLATYRHYAQVLANDDDRLEVVGGAVAPVLLERDLRRALAASGTERTAALNDARDLLKRFVPSLTHWSLVSPGGRILYRHGHDLPALPEADAERILKADAVIVQRVPVPGGLAIVRAQRLETTATSKRALAIIRLAVGAPTFPAFLLAQIRQDVSWIVLALVLATLVTSVLIAQLTRSLRSVASYARAIERGEVHGGLEIRTSDEASTIADAFNVVLHRLKQSYVSTLSAMAALLETKDRTTESHSLRGVRYALELGRAAGLTAQELTDLEYGALLHDIGKVGIADAILKKTGPLTEEEWAVMRQHPTIGYNVLRNLDFLQNALPVVLHHQERFDGRGYPNGLKGEEIPILARIFTIADSFDAMTSDRPYRRAMRPEIATQEMRRNGGAQFDPRLVDIFVRLWEEGKLLHTDGRPQPGMFAR